MTIATEVAPTSSAAVAAALPASRVPGATYRLQFNQSFPFAAARALADYLDELGVSDVYASPLFQARGGSTHGYDVCDPRRFSADLGGEADFGAFSDALRGRGMGLVLDVVPNHMGVNDPNNAWWMDVLENGPTSVYAPYFDIDWHPIAPQLANRVLIPVLDDQYGRVLEAGRFRLAFEDGAFFLLCGSIKLPVAPRTYHLILSHRVDDLVRRLGEDHEHVQELQSILRAVLLLPLPTDTDPDKRAENHREKEVIKRRLHQLFRSAAEVRELIDSALSDFDGTTGDARSFDRMHELIDAQSYRPAYWRVAAEEINYRRFFDINDLAAVRVEEPAVFDAAHQLVFKLLKAGKATGLRIDHPDGLWNPPMYFRKLQESFAAREGGRPPSDWFTAAGEAAETGRPAWPLYVVAEKILAPGEPLPHDWAVAGTTGYDFMVALNGLFVNRKNAGAFDRIYRDFSGLAQPFEQLVYAQKKMVMQVSMSSEINALANELNRLVSRNRLYRDFTLNSLTAALREVIACLPVYRTYVTGPGHVSPRDEGYVNRAVELAKRRNPRTATSLFDFVRDTVLLRNWDTFPEEDHDLLLHFAMKFQQVTGPVTAKGVEDSAFYVYYRLASLNEVGGEPGHFGTSLTSFHRLNRERRQRWPHSMLATSTHDNKRSEDVRARVNVLSELPDDWELALTRFARINEGYRTEVDGEPAPLRNDEYLYYQTLLGAWPMDLLPGNGKGVEPAGPEAAEKLAAFRERIIAYLLKACKEAQVRTSWINPNEPYEAALRSFVEHTLVDDPRHPFRAALRPLLRKVAFAGRFNSLAQVLVKYTSPGVPDTYQGAELFDFSLVDPDNRRPVDYDRRRAMLAELRARSADRPALARELVNDTEGYSKLYVTHQALTLRRERRELFASGEYLTLRADGRRRKHACAFARTLGGEAVVTVVPRLVAELTNCQQPPVGKVWRGTWLVLPRELAGMRFRDRLTGQEWTPRDGDGLIGIPLSEVLNAFPVALLESV